MIRLLPLAASLLATITLFSAVTVPVAAAEAGPAYRMVLATPTEGRFIAGETPWRCGGDGCIAPAGKSRPAIICAQAARSLGRVESFSVRGEAIAAKDLESCNKKAK
jgi:hypothetical protein